MSTQNINSSSIRVFPTTLRENADPIAKFTTEYNLTSLLNKLLDVQAFVVNTYDKIDTIDKKDNKYTLGSIDFNIMGYFFSIKSLDITDLISGTQGYINASISIKLKADPNAASFSNWWQLRGDDSDDVYNGLTLTSSATNTFTHTVNTNTGFNVGELISNVSTDTANLANDGYITYTFTILHYTLSENKLYINIPQESRIKFLTTKNSKYQSVAIDDGELTSL